MKSLYHKICYSCVAVFIGIMLSGCSGNGNSSGDSLSNINKENTEDVTKTPTFEKYAVKLLEGTEELTYVNNADISGIGDPYVFTYDNRYYMTSTTNGKVFDLYRSEDLKEWTFVRKIFQTSYTKGWVRANLWQPQIVIGKDGKFYLYYCGNNQSGSLRIGVAEADTVEGPYVDLKGEPLFDLRYATIDPNLFLDEDGKMYLYYSRDCSENIVDNKHTSQIYVVEMESYTKVKEGAEHKLLLTPEQTWELKSGDWLWNEGPDILKHNDKYYLFYSGNCYAASDYSIGYAVADQPGGPFTKYENNPVLWATKDMSGPGNNSFLYTLDKKEMFIAYHTHTIPIVGGGDRKLTIDRCGFREDGTFFVNGPTNIGQPLPSGEKSRINSIEGITVSSSAEGRKAEFLMDGGISKSSNDSSYEWITAAGDNQNYIEIDFGKAQSISEIALYRCYEDNRLPKALKITFDDGGTIENIVPSADVLEPVLLNFEPIKTQKIKIEATIADESSSFGLAEIMFFE